jgi:hypothetical protein
MNAFFRTEVMETSLSSAGLRTICEAVGNEPAVRAKPSLAPVHVATRVVQLFLGSDWIKKAIDPALPHGDVLRPRFTPDDQSAADAPRLMYLAETLLNVQQVEGFAGMIERARLNRAGSGLSELHVARMLVLAGANFRFFNPKGIWGQDYALEIVYPDGLVAPCETSAALKSGELTAANILRALEKGRPQLPESGAGVMFLMVPRAWFADDQRKIAERTMTEAALEFFRGSKKRRGTKRVMTVKYYGDPILRDGNLAPTPVREVTNLYNPAYANRNWDLFAAQPAAAPREWISLSDYIAAR